MNIYDRAMRLEREGAHMYRAFARKAPDRGARNILGWLADQEDRHFKIIREMKEGNPRPPKGKVNFKHIRGVFRGIRKYAAEMEPDSPQAALYRKALSVEKRSVVFYARRARSTKDGTIRRILHRLADEERRHVVIVENLLELVTRPSRWVASAEISHIGEEY